jgi:hypothetical protein
LLKSETNDRPSFKRADLSLPGLVLNSKDHISDLLVAQPVELSSDARSAYSFRSGGKYLNPLRNQSGYDIIRSDFQPSPMKDQWVADKINKEKIE